MAIQITVRLPEDLVTFVDAAVKGGAASRAAVVSRALERERRRTIAERDAVILADANAADPDDLDDLAGLAATTPMDDLD